MRFIHWRQVAKAKAYPNLLIHPSMQRKTFLKARKEGWPPPDLRRIPESLPGLRRILKRRRRLYVEIPPHVLQQTGLQPDDLVFVHSNGGAAVRISRALAAAAYKGGNGDG